MGEIGRKDGRMSILATLAMGKRPTVGEIVVALEDKCELTRPDCDSGCPVFEVIGHVPWNKKRTSCMCRESGRKMLEFLRKKGEQK